MNTRAEVGIGDLIRVMGTLKLQGRDQAAEVCQFLGLQFAKADPPSPVVSQEPKQTAPESKGNTKADKSTQDPPSTKTSAPRTQSPPSTHAGTRLAMQKVPRPEPVGWWMAAQPVSNDAVRLEPEVALFERASEPELLRTLLTTWAARGPLDVSSLVQAAAEKRAIHTLPRESIRCIADRIQVLLDRRDRMAPFLDDQDVLVRRLNNIAGATVQVESFVTRPQEVGPLWSPKAWPLPDADTLVLIVSDLRPSLDSGCEPSHWRELGHALRECGVMPVVLSPVPASQIPRDLQKLFVIQYWDRSTRPLDLHRLLDLRRRHV